MSLNSANEDLNDAFETRFPPIQGVKKLFFNFSTSLLFRALKWRRMFFGGRILVGERIVEYPQIFKWIKSPGSPPQRSWISAVRPLACQYNSRVLVTKFTDLISATINLAIRILFLTKKIYSNGNQTLYLISSYCYQPLNTSVLEFITTNQKKMLIKKRWNALLVG